MSKHLIHVAAGAIRDADGRILITKRPDHAHQGGLWEFPGGKLEAGETAGHGLARELDEELGIRVTESRPLIRIHHDYGDRHVLLDVHRVDVFEGEPTRRNDRAVAHPARADRSDCRTRATALPPVGRAEGALEARTVTEKR